MTAREQTRLTVMSLMDRSEYTVSQAAVVLGISERQVWRIRAAYRKEGAAGLIHGNRGREANRRCSTEVRRRVVELAGSEQYQGCNQVHLTELLAKREGIELARSTVRRILALSLIHI